MNVAQHNFLLIQNERRSCILPLAFFFQPLLRKHVPLLNILGKAPNFSQPIQEEQVSLHSKMRGLFSQTTDDIFERKW